jgi:enoyl-CoA hydratase/carnithine racemase
MAALQRERLDAGIEVVRLDRPQARNALDSAALAELEAALSELATDDELRVLVLSTTSTSALCAGADVV